jgi:hypothetical protein
VQLEQPLATMLRSFVDREADAQRVALQTLLRQSD